MKDIKKPVIALMYDFDKTLCTTDMQEYTFIPNVGMTPHDFWAEASAISKGKKMDSILAYMWVMLEKAHAAHISIRREDFVRLGKDLELYEGVEEWFERIKRIGEDLNVEVEHYIISSGLREIIEGSCIYKNFKEVFACEFLYDENDVACWPKNAVNYTTKTQFLFRINKGVLDISDDVALNSYTPMEDRRIPFRNMIYIGDGLTDVPCMRLVNANGGHSIAVYKDGKRDIVDDLLLHDRVDFVAPADYREGKELDEIVKAILCKMSMEDSLKKHSDDQRSQIKINK